MTDHKGTPVFIGVGSNLEDPRAQARKAVAALSALRGCHILAISSWYVSKAVGPGSQPDYVNGVVALLTKLSPYQLLDHLQHIESHQGRVRTVRWGPRTLDLDVLNYGDLVLNDIRLTLPHPGLADRNFVLLPLAEIAPDLVLADGHRVPDLLAKCSFEGIVRLPVGD